MPPPDITQVNGNNPTVTFKTPTGQTVTAPLDQAPPQVQLLYQQLPQAQAQTSTAQSGAVSAQAQASQQQVAALQKKAQLGLSSDLKDRMTLPSAIKKYTALGMNADDVFKQYLGESPWGLPNQNPQQLQELGVTTDALGKIGDPGSFMDRYNTKNAISGLRNLQDLWKKTNSLSRLGGILGTSVDTSNYDTAKQIFGNHLSTLIPGAPGGQQTAQDLLNTLPNAEDPREDIPGKASGQFKAIEDQLLKTKGYSYKDLGLGAPAGQKSTTGGSILTSLLGDFVNPVKNAASATTTENSTLPPSKGNLGQSVVNAAQATGNLAKNTLGNPDILNEAATVGTLPDLLALASKAPGGIAALTDLIKGGAKGAETTVDALKGNPIKDFLNPKGIVTRGGNVRNAIIDQATKAGTTIDGDDIVAELKKSADTLKRGNLGQGDIIDQSIKDAKTAFGGKTLTPQEAANAYAEADPGFTKTGIPKSTIQSNIDRNLRDILGNQLEQAAPGWDQATSTMAKGYQAQKAPIRKIAKRGAEVGLGVAGLDELRRLFSGL